MIKLEYGSAFKRQLAKLQRRYRHIRDDVQPLLERLLADETPGDQISGVGYTLYKIRLTNQDSRRGKQGGYRVIYYLKQVDHCILVTIYAKSEREDVSAAELARWMADVEAELGG